MQIAGHNVLMGKVEKHLDDRNKGRGPLKSEVPGTLADLNTRSSARLSRMNPTALQSYQSYSTALTYDQRARYIRGMAGAVDVAEILRKTL